MYKSNTKDETQPKEDILPKLQDNIREAGDQLRKTGRKVRDVAEHTRDEVTQATEAVTTRIHERPVQSSLIALGMGFILGAFLRG
jgi:ElaB/YqjD/DUF883 family membrane-anchored ribosome-binding protein